MKKSFVLLYLLLSVLFCNAQGLVVTSDLQHMGSVGKSEYVDFGDNVKVAKIIVELNSLDITFENPEVIISNVEKETGRYEFFAKVNNKKKKNYFNILDDKGNKIRVNLVTADGRPLTGGEAYQIKVKKVHDEGKPKGSLKISSFPVGAEVFINGESVGATSNNPLEEIIFANEKHLISFRLDGYVDMDTIVKVGKNETALISANLESGKSRVRINTDIPYAQAVIDDSIYVALPYNGALDYGLHKITGNATYINRRHQSLNFPSPTKILKANDNRPRINDNLVFTGELTVNASSGVKGRRTKIEIEPYDRDSTRLIKDTHHGAPSTSHRFQGLYGDYKVKVSSEMSKTREDSIHVNPGDTIIKNYALERSNGKVIFTYRPTLRSLASFSLGFLYSVWGVYFGGGTNFTRSEYKDSSSKGAEYYVNGIKSSYGVMGAIYNPNSWLYFHLGVGYGSYESAGYYIKSKNGETEKVPSRFDECEKFAGGVVDAGIGFFIKGLYIDFGYNAIIGEKITPFETNLMASIGVKF